ncbi:pseudouridylate synthase, putative [Plasmodium chabaudi adami]|uniref:Pseudouridylate synthase, putative n=1 Tax=Plasmodium chabaudi adami TaxID=5826 RepID=A0A1D3S174_PLACE|nr:pseudouridylate synthase, putative [Plasmodium chabaudi adami]
MDESAKNPQKRKNNYLKNKERIEKLKFERNQRRKTEHEKNEEIKDGQYEKNEEVKDGQYEKNNKFKKYGLCVGYIGSRYHGCQGQGKEHMTIENEIERTLTKINAVKNNSKGFNYCLSRSARTDLGVHALYNLFVYNINIDVCEGENGNGNGNDNSKPENGLVNNETNPPKCDENNEENSHSQNVSENNNPLNTNNDKKNNTYEERKRKEKKFIKLLNSNLPNDIKCFDIYKVTKSFDARKFCSFRLYEYLFPTYVLSPVQVVPKYEKIFEECVKHIDEYVENHKEAKKKKKETEKEKGKQHDEENGSRIDKPDEESDKKVDKPDEENKVETKKTNGKAWGLETEDIFTIKEEKSDLTDDELNNLFEIFSNYRGYHNFHCFTKNNIDTTTFRYIKYFDVSTVKLYDHNFISIRILGQSFLMHQIRKMITLAVETFRNATPKNSIYYSLNTKSYIPILLFPPDGLMLVCPYFNSYNEKVCNPPDTPQICFDENEEILNFKKDQIGKSIIEKINQNVWKDWMAKINKYPFIYHFMKTKIEEEKTETNS